MGVQPLNLEDKLEIEDPDYVWRDEVPVRPVNIGWGFDPFIDPQGIFRVDHIIDRTILNPLPFHHHQIHMMENWYLPYRSGIVRNHTKKEEKKKKKEKERDDLIKQILCYVRVPYKCNYYFKKEVVHSYPPSAPIHSSFP